MKAVFCIFVYFQNYVFFVYKYLYFKEIMVYNVSLNLTLHIIFRTLILKMHGLASRGHFFPHTISHTNSPYTGGNSYKVSTFTKTLTAQKLCLLETWGWLHSVEERFAYLLVPV